MKRHLRSSHTFEVKIIPLLVLLSIAASPVAAASDLVISGAVDGPLTSGTPKAVEFYALNDIADLSVYGFGSANNGGGTDGQEFTFPPASVAAGTHIYLATESAQFISFFGFAPDYTSGAVAINGDDALELFENGVVVDIFGDINVDGTGQPWEHLDGWAYRNIDSGPDCNTFVVANWTFSGPNALDDETSNSSAATPFPIGTFTTVRTDSGPCVINTSPAAGSSGVPVDADISIDFNEAVSATPTAITVSCVAGGAQSGTISGSPSSTIVWNGDVDFGAGDGCTVTVVAAEVADVDANDPPDNMPGDNVFSFTAASGGGSGGGGWVVNEIHADPAGDISGDANGDGVRNATGDEFVEIVNNTGSDADISGWSVSDGFGSRHTFPAGTVVTDQCSIVIFGGGTPTGEFGNSEVQIASSGSLGLNNGGDDISLNDGVSDVATASYGGEGGNNQSVTLDPDITGLPPHVLHTLATGSGGTLYSPGTNINGSGFAGCPPPAAQWAINEIHADPAAGLGGDANGDGIRSATADEFVEIVNNSGSDSDISGWTLSDGFGERHTFPAGTVVPDQCAIVVFGGPTPTGIFGNSVVQTASSGSLGLNNGGDGVFLNDGVSDVATAGYGSEGGANQSLTLDPDITGELPYVQHTVVAGSGGTLYSPGTRIDGAQFVGCPTTAEIFEIQGSGLFSPLDGRPVRTTDNVVTAVGTDGFFIQTPEFRNDFDPDTSNGIFVFTDSAPTVAVGDLVNVSGTVQEFFGFTEINAISEIAVTGSEVVPTAVVFDASTPSPDPDSPSCAIELECYESMLVQIDDGSVTGPNQRFGVDPIAEVHITAAPDRTYREPGLEPPGMAGLPVWDGNPEVFELDPDKLGLPNQVIPAGSGFSATGVIGFEFGGYELWPNSLNVDVAPIPRAVRDPEPMESTVGSLNLFRLFDDIDDPAGTNVFGEPTDDAVVSSDEYQRRLSKFALYIVASMKTPDIIGVQEVESLKVLDDLAAAIDAVSPGTGYEAYLVDGNDIGGIDVGFLVRAERVDVNGVVQLGAAETYINPEDGQPDILHDRPPLLLSAGIGVSALPIDVMVVHNRSLSGIDTERVQVKRFEQAQSIAQMVQGLQAGAQPGNVVVVGDFNGFEFSDGYVDTVGHIRGVFDPADSLLSGVDLVDPDLANQVLSLPEAERYSFIFRGNAQVLDHALTSMALDEHVRGLQYARGNADAAVDLINDDATPLRASDHDGLVLYVDTTGLAAPVNLVGRAKGLRVNVAWQGPEDASSYRVFRRLDSETDFMEVGQVSNEVFVDDLPVGTLSAEYYVVAENAFGQSGPSEIVVVTPTSRRRR